MDLPRHEATWLKAKRLGGGDAIPPLSKTLAQQMEVPRGIRAKNNSIQQITRPIQLADNLAITDYTRHQSSIVGLTHRFTSRF